MAVASRLEIRAGRGPLPGSYRITERLFAGPSPALADIAAALDWLRLWRVESIVDLTEDGELPAYAAHARAVGLQHRRLPVANHFTPEVAGMEAILDAIDSATAVGPAYLHCQAGVGRTGTVVACWLVRRGARPWDALQTVAQLRALLQPDQDSPWRTNQIAFVHAWGRRQGT